MNFSTNKEEAFNAVNKINEELYEKYKEDLNCLPILSITFASDMFFINLSIPYDLETPLPEIMIYSSIENDRIYYEKSDRYETFYKLIKRKFLDVKYAINKVKL